MLDKDELMYTKILHGNTTIDEITDYIDELHTKIKKIKKEYDVNIQIRNMQNSKILKQKRIIDLMAERLTTPIHSKEWIKNYYEDKVGGENER